MNIDFSAFRGISDYNFKKDGTVFIKFSSISKTDKSTMKKVQFTVTVAKTGEVIYVSKKGCLEFVEGTKYENVSKTWFPSYRPVKYFRLRFKKDFSSQKEFKRFNDFCSNRKSGRDIYDLFLDVLNKYNYKGESLEDFKGSITERYSNNDVFICKEKEEVYYTQLSFFSKLGF